MKSVSFPMATFGKAWMRAGVLASLLLATALTGNGAELRVMTFNLWHGGEAGGQPIEQSVAVVRAANADIVGFQETGGRERGGGERPDNGKAIAARLGWHYFDQGGRTGIASRYPILGHTELKSGVTIRLDGGESVAVFNAHLAHAPYQPYQLLGIPYADAPFLGTPSEAVQAAQKARGAQVQRLLLELAPALQRGDVVFLTGDFNEPSFQDWTERAAAAGKCPLPVPYPTTRVFTEAGLRDAFRASRPDEVADPGWTWTPLTRPDDPKDRHDRIDFVFFGGRNVRCLGSSIIGERAEAADIVVRPYPSDHRAVVAVFQWGASSATGR